MAVADVNKDGLDDFYVCGASFQPGALMIQTTDGKFKESALTVSSRMKATEETDAVFFDANNDGWPDLYVTSGGNEYDDGNPALKDNLYLNDGKGNLSRHLIQYPKWLKTSPAWWLPILTKMGIWICLLADSLMQNNMA